MMERVGQKGPGYPMPQKYSAWACSVSELAISATEQEELGLELGFQRQTTVRKVPHDLRETLDLILCEIQSSDTEKAAQAEV